VGLLEGKILEASKRAPALVDQEIKINRLLILIDAIKINTFKIVYRYRSDALSLSFRDQQRPSAR
jgi:hypothetical protein